MQLSVNGQPLQPGKNSQIRRIHLRFFSVEHCLYHALVQLKGNGFLPGIDTEGGEFGIFLRRNGLTVLFPDIFCCLTKKGRSGKSIF